MTRHVFVDEAFAATLLRGRGYVVLTAEEAARVALCIETGGTGTREGELELLALLTPNQEAKV